MAKYIDADTMVSMPFLDDSYGIEKHTVETDTIENLLDRFTKEGCLEPADVVPVRHGHWALVGWHKGMKVVECSCCKKRAIGATDFCPNCGAKMDREEQNV